MERRPPAAEDAYRNIRSDILSGKFPVGSPLRIQNLAERVGTSAMPVRESLRRLEQSGLVERFPFRGAVVKERSLADMQALYDVRLLTERELTRLGCAGVSASGVAQMNYHLREMLIALEAGRQGGWLDHQQASLAALYENAGNPVLAAMTSGLWDRCRPQELAAMKLGESPSLGGEWLHLQTLVQAAAAADAVEAVAAIDALVSATSMRVQRLLAT